MWVLLQVWFQNRRARERRLLHRVGYSPDVHKSQSWTTSGTVPHLPISSSLSSSISSSLSSSCGVSSHTSVHGTPILRGLLDPDYKAVSSVSNLPDYCFSTMPSKFGQYPEQSLYLQSPISGQNCAPYRPNLYGATTDPPVWERRAAYAAGGCGYYKDHSWHRSYADGRLYECATTTRPDLPHWDAMSFNWSHMHGTHSSCSAGLSSRNTSTCRVIAGYVPEESGYDYGVPFSCCPVVNWNYVAGTTENCLQLTWNASDGITDGKHDDGKPGELVNWNVVSGGSHFVAVEEESLALAIFNHHQQPHWCALYHYRDVENTGSSNETEEASQVVRETDVLQILLEKEKEEAGVFSRTVIAEPDSTMNHYFNNCSELQDCREACVRFASQPVPNSQTADFNQPFETVGQDGSIIWNCPASHISSMKSYRNFQAISEVQGVYQTEYRLDGGNFPGFLPIVADVHQNDLLQVVQNTSRIARLQDPLQMVHDHRWNSSSSSSCLTNWHRLGNGNLSLDVQSNRPIVHSESGLRMDRSLLPQSSMHQDTPVHGFPAHEWNWTFPASRFQGYPMNPSCSSYVQNQNTWNQQRVSNGIGFQSSSLAATNRMSDVGSSSGQLAEAAECGHFVQLVAQGQEITTGEVIDCDGSDSSSVDSSEMNSSSASQL